MGMSELICLRKWLPPDTKLISRLEDANDWPTWNRQHQARTHTTPWTDGLQDHTSTHMPLSHSMPLLLFLCHPSHHHLILILFSNSWHLLLCLWIYFSSLLLLLYPSVFLSVHLSSLFLKLNHCTNPRSPVVHLSSIATALPPIQNSIN